MRAAMLVEPGRLEFVDLPRPDPAPGEVVVRVRAALTCGTDLKAYRRGHPMWPMPTRFGHEFSGDLAAVGAGVNGFREGDRVLLAPTAPCGRCFWCDRDQENLCESLMAEMVLGGYAEYVRIPSRVVRVNLFSCPSSLPAAEAALLEPLSCVVHGLEESRLRAGDRVVLLGSGGIALLFLAVLRARGVADVRVVARNRARAEIAASLGGAVVALDATESEAIVEGPLAGRRADLVIECTGRPEVWEAAPKLARRGGEVILFGGCPAGTRVALDATTLHYDQVRIRSPFHFTPRAVAAARDLLISGGMPARALLSDHLPLERLAEAFDRMQRAEGIKYVIEP